jgi:hypothetical protein
LDEVAAVAGFAPGLLLGGAEYPSVREVPHTPRDRLTREGGYELVGFGEGDGSYGFSGVVAPHFSEPRVPTIRVNNPRERLSQVRADRAVLADALAV